MNDPRRTLPILESAIEEPLQIVSPVADLLRKPDGPIDCQLLFGAAFTVIQRKGDWALGQALADDYIGYIHGRHLGKVTPPTHKVSATSGHRYSAPELKSKPVSRLSFGSLLCVQHQRDNYAALSDGSFVPAPQISPITQYADDFVAVFESFLGIPYLWGGGSTWGMDCSAAVQMSLWACGIPCPRDSDMQEAEIGKSVAPGSSLKRGDLVFWQGHVGAMLDDRNLIHANAYHMAVAIEPLETAVSRIKGAGGGPITSCRRMPSL